MSEAADDEATASVSEGLQMIRDDAARQLRHLGERIDQLDISKLPRFSANLPDELSPQQLVELQRRVADLEPWLQGPFLLAGNYVDAGRWRNDHRWEAIGITWDRISPASGSSTSGQTLAMTHSCSTCAEPLRSWRSSRSSSSSRRRFLESHYQTGVKFEQIGWQRLHPECTAASTSSTATASSITSPTRLGCCRSSGRWSPTTASSCLARSCTPPQTTPSTYGSSLTPTRETGPGGSSRAGWRCAGCSRPAGFEAEELLLTEGPRGEFTTMSSYFRCQPTEPASGLTPPAAGPPVRFPAGHYYSPMSDANELPGAALSEIWPPTPRTTPDVRLARRGAARAVSRCVRAGRRRWTSARHQDADETIYWADKDQYPPLDAWVLAAILRSVRPARMIEVGSGFSSLITARVNREELDGALDFTCIEPYPRGFLMAGVAGHHPAARGARPGHAAGGVR